MGGYKNESSKVRKSQQRNNLHTMPISMDSGTHKGTPHVYGDSGHSMETGLGWGDKKGKGCLIGGHLYVPVEKSGGFD